MSGEFTETEFDPSYIAGLLDGIGRVRFDLSETDESRYSVRPMLRIKPYGTRMRAAVVGGFLEERGYRYDYIDRTQSDDFFRLQLRGDLEDLEEYLRGESAHLVRELEFVNGVFAEQFDFEILDPEDACRFLLTRDELRYGWRPRGRHHVSPADVAESHGVDLGEVQPASLPTGSFRSDYAIEWIAGVFDALCRYRPSIAQSDEYAIGYAMYPVARLAASGVDFKFVDSFTRFCDDYDISFGNSSGRNGLHVSFTGTTNIRRVLDVVFPRLLVLAEHSEVLLNAIFPRFEEEEHHDRDGFYRLLRDFDPIARDSGGPFRRREYDPDYFADVWRDDLDLVRAEGALFGAQAGEPESDPLQELEPVTVSPDRFADSVGRFWTIAETQLQDPESVRELKSLYADRCQLCEDRLASGDGTGYSEVHHLRPLNGPHDGPSDPENMIVLCPTHHADFDNGVVRVDVESLTVHHPFDSDVDGATITTKGDHDIAAEHLRYHNRNVCTLREVPR